MTPAEVAQRYSFPEIFLVLRRSDNRRRADLSVMATAQMLGSAAPWSKESGQRASDFIKSLANDKPAKKAGQKSLVRMFSAAGIPVIVED
jgi:hypothetical protein